jgi:glycosyltransferase involved in cell wall biosynthesis
MVKHNSDRCGYTINILYLITRLFEWFNYAFADQVIVYSPNLAKEWNLSRFSNKISIAYEHFLDVNIFKVTKNLSSRDNTIGYIGRLSEEKGIMEFVRAIPKTLSINDNLNFLICGNGSLKNKIELYLKKNNLTDHVRLMAAIPHDYLPNYLNNLKLIVISSYTEGLPNVMLESMACGTPVLATSVGAIPDIIKDGRTGLLMESNSSDCIASNIIRALEHPDLEGIAMRARAVVESEFTFERAVERWRKVLGEDMQYR